MTHATAIGSGFDVPEQVLHTVAPQYPVRVTNPGLRASDEDRRRVVDALERHTAAGRLSLDEFADRVDRALAAATHADLATVVHDLPPDPPPPSVGGAGAERRALLIAFLIAAIALLVLGIGLALGR
jgi:hypothetical protein